MASPPGTRNTRPMNRFRRPLLYLLSFQLCMAGFMHLLTPDFFVRIVPPGLPNPEWLNVISGLFEIVIGVYLLEPRTRVLAAWGAIALAIAVYPANVNMLIENIGPESLAQGAPPHPIASLENDDLLAASLELAGSA